MDRYQSIENKGQLDAFLVRRKNPVHGRGSLKELVMESDNFNENPIEFQWAPLLKSSPATLGARGTVLDGSNGVAQFKRRTQSSEERT